MPGNVLFVAYQIPPIGGPAAQRHLRFLNRLPGCGWQPVILSVEPKDCEEYYQIDQSLLCHLPQQIPSVRARSFNPMDKALKLKGRILNRENVPPGIGPANKGNTPGSPAEVSFWQQGKDFISELFRIPDRQIGWYPFAVCQGRKVIKKGSIDVIYSSGNPWTCHLVAMKLALSFNLPWVADFRDPWVGNPYKNRRYAFIERLESRLEQRVVESATYVVANTEPLRKQFIARYPGLDPEKIVHISNGYLDDLFRQYRRPVDNKRFTLSHVGSLYARRSPAPILEAVAALKQKGVFTSENFLLRFVGVTAVQDANPAVLREMGLEEMVELIPPVSHAKALEYLASSDVLLLIQPATKLQIPGKTFEYVAMAKPVFAVTGQGATADLIEQEEIGVAVDPENVDEIAAKLERMYLEHQQGTLHYSSAAVLKKFESRPLTEKLAQLFDNCRQ